jgi:hypothetical protein
MIYTNVTIYNFPPQTNWKRHVKIISFNFTHLSFGFNAAILDSKLRTTDPKQCNGSTPCVWPTMLLAAKCGASSSTPSAKPTCGQRCCWLPSVALVVLPLHPLRNDHFCRNPKPLLIIHPNIKKYQRNNDFMIWLQTPTVFWLCGRKYQRINDFMIWLQTPTVFSLCDKIISHSYLVYMRLVILGRQKYKQHSQWCLSWVPFRLKR